LENKNKVDEAEKIIDNLSEKVLKPSRVILICNTLVYLGPILWVYLNIYDENYSVLYWNVSIAFVATMLLTFSWVNYFHRKKNYKADRESLKKEFMEAVEKDKGIEKEGPGD